MTENEPSGKPIPGWPNAPVSGPSDAAGGTPPPDPTVPGYGPGPTPPAGGYPPPNVPPGPGGYPPPAAPPPGMYPPGPQAPAPGYGYGYGGYGGYPVARDHPQGTTILVLGICGWVICGIAAPVAWYMGNQALREIDQNPAAYSNRGSVQAGRILGMVYSILALVGLGFLALLVVITLAAGSSGS